MDLVLYRLSVSGLAVSALMIAVFFAVLRRSVPRVEMRWWAYGWAANSVALIVTWLFWYTQPPTPFHGLVFAVYMAAKDAYVWLLLRGALELCGRRPRLLAARIVVPTIVVFSVAGIFWITSRDRLGLVTQVVVGAGFVTGTVALLRARQAVSTWLIVGFVARIILAVTEGSAYLVNVVSAAHPGRLTWQVPGGLLAAHYSFDTGAEWLIAMGCVIVVSQRMQRDLRQANTQMLAAQADLRRLADRDPLTALANRRTLPEIFRSVQSAGAMVIFFDLNDFKKINDEHGHHAGDECLVRFGRALTESFRPHDAVVRYAGDEFLVVASGMDEPAVVERIDAVRAKVRSTVSGELTIRFSYGIGRLAAGGRPDEALKAADEAMYRAKPAGGTAALPAIRPIEAI